MTPHEGNIVVNMRDCNTSSPGIHRSTLAKPVCKKAAMLHIQDDRPYIIRVKVREGQICI